MLEICNLNVCYRQTQAIENLSLKLRQGEVTGLLGANGAGKSTLLRAILGLIPATGTISWGGKPVSKQLDRVAYVPQRTQIDWDYPVTVERVVMMGRAIKTGLLRRYSKKTKALVCDALKRVGMWQYRQRQIRELSGGQQQRVFLARAIAQEADLLLLDEPFNNVDRQTEQIIYALFAQLKQQQKTLLVVSHDLSQTLDNYDRLILLDKKTIADGTKEEVLTNANINRAYKRCFAPSLSPSLGNASNVDLKC